MPIRPSNRPTERTRERAKELRKHASFPEKRLWGILQSRKLGGLKFRRQHPVEPYIVDFYCPEAALVIEVDGKSHAGRKEYDDQRTAFLKSRGLTVLRVHNDDVLENLDGVAHAILKAAFNKLGRSFPP